MESVFGKGSSESIIKDGSVHLEATIANFEKLTEAIGRYRSAADETRAISDELFQTMQKRSNL
jgi:hypothetical protein